MANTVTYGPGTINIVPDGSADYDSRTYFPGGLKVVGVKFYASADTDVFALEDAASGTQFTKFVGTGKDETPEGVWRFPYFDASDCTFGTAASCEIIIEYI